MSDCKIGSCSAAEQDLKRRRLLDAGGPVEDDEKARQKMRDAEVGENFVITGFDPDNVVNIKCLSGIGSHGIYTIKPMGYFCWIGDLKMMRWLYVNGADTRDEDVKRWFPMYGAALYGDLESCNWLFDRGSSADIQRRTSDDKSPLSAIFYRAYRREASRWLVLKGALCKDDDSGDLDLGLMRKYLGGNSLCVQERQLLLEWAGQQHQVREAFLVFLMGTLSPPEYSPVTLRELLLEKLESEEATDRKLDSLPSNQHQNLWDDLLVAKQRARPLGALSGKSGILELVCDYVGIVRGREARIIRQLTEILPELIKEFD